jgi:hypothetical protein
LTLSFWIILHGWIYPGKNLTCTLSFCIYFVGISYSRLRWNLLNDTYLKLYKGRDYFEWKDVILGMQTRVGKINNRLNNSVPFQHIPKRQTSRTAEETKLQPENPEVQKTVTVSTIAAATAEEKKLQPENPEVQKVVIVSTVAVATAVGAKVLVGNGFVRYMLSSEEKQAVMFFFSKKELDRAEAQEAKALAKNHLLQNPITDAAKEARALSEEEAYLAIESRVHAQQHYNQALAAVRLFGV